MPYKEKPVERKYYPIGLVARDLGVAPSLIRFWEKRFPEIKPKKNKNGKRLYTNKEIEKIHLIFNLVKEKGYTLNGARAHLSNHENEGTDTDMIKVIDTLSDLKKSLLDLKDKL